MTFPNSSKSTLCATPPVVGQNSILSFPLWISCGESSGVGRTQSGGWGYNEVKAFYGGGRPGPSGCRSRGRYRPRARFPDGLQLSVRAFHRGAPRVVSRRGLRPLSRIRASRARGRVSVHPRRVRRPGLPICHLPVERMPEQHELLRARRGTRVRRALPSAPRQASRSLVRHRAGYEWISFAQSQPGFSSDTGLNGFELLHLDVGADLVASPNLRVGSFLEFKLRRYRNLDAASGGSSTSTGITNKALHEFLTLGFRLSFLP